MANSVLPLTEAGLLIGPVDDLPLLPVIRQDGKVVLKLAMPDRVKGRSTMTRAQLAQDSACTGLHQCTVTYNRSVPVIIVRVDVLEKCGTREQNRGEECRWYVDTLLFVHLCIWASLLGFSLGLRS